MRQDAFISYSHATQYLPSETVVEGAATGAGECGATWEGEVDVVIRRDASGWPEEQRQTTH